MIEIKENSMKLYHGSNESDFKFDKDYIYSIFDGLFASADREVAESHGRFIYEFKIEEDKILDSYKLSYEIDAEKIKSALLTETNLTTERIEKYWNFIVHDEKPSEDFYKNEKINCDERAEFSWEMQRLRGRLAKVLGYHAIEMQDEHGTTCLIVSENILIN